ncbi:hypothetical protein K431DRAFT_251835 [Polychaeton citri CBS 116435]|uniref:Queuosine 5'-phosphate N-glycosylase/hydrolase n=1 Tax=Polychaeton citri CBS 116435 TaxID=1314669 RepID=A0A9P4Q3I8_9PEZI|nr:hypothetical protein K431DRAFT_251835 [Polychaeton citri CBS 116435]
MSDDEADPELLELLRQRLGLGKPQEDGISSNTGVLDNAEYVYNNAIDVTIDMLGTKGAAASVYKNMQKHGYSSESWDLVELHPKPSEGFSDVDIVNFVFTMDLLNFSFWSELSESERFQVDYRGRCWTGYGSLLACIRRALEEQVPITNPHFWISGKCTDTVLKRVFRSATEEQIPLLDLRIERLREAGEVLTEMFSSPDEDSHSDIETDSQQKSDEPPMSALDVRRVSTDTDNTLSKESVHDETHVHEHVGDVIGATEMKQSQIHTGEALAEPQQATSATEDTTLKDPRTLSCQQSVAGTFAKYWRPSLCVVNLVREADKSAGKLVNLLARHFQAFADETRFEGHKIRFLKRAQILVADLWAAFKGTSHGEFYDIDCLTMFADYRVPQMLHSLGVLAYSPLLEGHVRRQERIPSGHAWEIQLRGCSIWAVEMIRRSIMQEHPQASVNAVLIDFFLYDLAKERELAGVPMLPHHRTRTGAY